MRLLYITNQVYQLSPSNAMLFKLLADLGHKVFWAANFSDYRGDVHAIPCVHIHIDIHPNPLKDTNRKAFKQLCAAIEAHGIDAIHCNTPIGSLLGRLAGAKKQIRPIIYTAHGFLFYEGCPLVNRTVYYLEEALLARLTDVLITINRMDYMAAKKFRLRKGGELRYVHGAGVASLVDKTAVCGIRKELGIENAFMCFSAARLDANKNIETVIEAISLIDNPCIHYVVAGDGSSLDQLKTAALKHGVENRIHFIGYRSDMPALFNEADLFVLSSVREGLSRSLMEAMAHGLACVVSQARGNQDLLGRNEGGIICETKNPLSYKQAIEYLFTHSEERRRMGLRNQDEVKQYSLERVREEYKLIYEKWLT